MLSYKLKKGKKTATLELTGILTEDSNKKFSEGLDKLLNEESGSFNIDFKGVSIIDSMGIGKLLTYTKHFAAQDKIFSISNVSQELYSLLKELRIDRVINITH